MITTGRHNKDVTKGVMLHNIVVALHLSKVVVVSPSMSGTYSVPYVLNAEYRSEIAGYIPVAPVISPAYSAEDFGALNKVGAPLHVPAFLYETMKSASSWLRVDLSALQVHQK